MRGRLLQINRRHKPDSIQNTARDSLAGPARPRACALPFNLRENSVTRRAVMKHFISVYFADGPARLAYALMKEAHHAINYYCRDRSRSPILNASVDTGAEPRRWGHPGFFGVMGPSLHSRLRAASIGSRSGREQVPCAHRTASRQEHCHPILSAITRIRS
jgi:hypothetical protein